MAKQADDMQTLAMSRLEYLWESGHVYCEIDPVLSRSLLYVEDPFKVLECCARRAKRSSRGSILNCSPYSLDMVKTAAQYNINLAAKIQQRLCTFCGTLYIPGANCSVRIQRANHAQRNRKEVPAASSKDHCDMETDIDGQHAKRNQPTVRNPNGSTRLPETEKMSTVNVRCGYCNRVSVFEGASKSGLKPPTANRRPEPAVPSRASGQSERPATPLSKPHGRPVPATAPPQARGGRDLSSPLGRPALVGQHPGQPLAAAGTPLQADALSKKSSKKKKKQGLRDMIQAKADQSKGGNSGRSLSDFLSSL